MAKKVVFVDDSPTVIMSLKEITKNLVDENIIETVMYNNPITLLEDIEVGLEFDLLIMDINMPQMNGIVLLEEIRKIITNKPILALTTETSNEVKDKAKELKINGWISKPYNDEKIIKAIKRVLKI